jgi:hypothetical protein
MKRAFAAIGVAIFAASASAQSAPSTADFVKTIRDGEIRDHAKV